ncbi:hypothetical protein QBC35DRAFT_505785 [Podospora australis]|uniref:Rhodopsin domain-containing protein n=1 Tax=Podospora australis TaxID=1536484 RepID=A0AAN7AG06_9PEZI|nr:hypothetical protein QBC35DRAFT_505785 [Podospora australis]
MADPTNGVPLEQAFAPTGSDYIAQTPFIVLNWFFFALCLIAFSVRVYIRFVCFRRLLWEDYLMLVALILHSAEAVLVQLYIPYMYKVERAEKGDYSVITPDFFDHANMAFVAFGASINLTFVGVLIIKMNFLLFFKTLGSSVRGFNIAWWLVTLFTIGVTLAQIGMQQFKCFFGGADFIFSGNCTTKQALKHIFFGAIFSSAADAFSDILIVCFPIAILWNSGITLRKKLALTFVFSLVWFTIAVTIVRGAVFHNQYSASADADADVQMQSPTFTWFWFYIEFSVAFIIACIVSFRSLFVQRAKKSSAVREEQERREAAYRSAIRRGWRYKLAMMQDSVLDTCRTLEGWTGSSEETLHMNGLPNIQSGLMTVDFQDDRNWRKKLFSTTTTTTTVRSSHENREYAMDKFDPRPVSAQNAV